jgi:hypothetical protein
MGRAAARARDSGAELAEAFAAAAERHADEPDVHRLCALFAEQADAHAAHLGARAEDGRDESPGTQLVLDLSRLYVLAERALVDATAARQGALAARDGELADELGRQLEETQAQARWLLARVKTSAPQAFAVE